MTDVGEHRTIDVESVSRTLRIEQPSLRPRDRSETAFDVDAPWMHLIPGKRPILFLVYGSQLFEVTPAQFEALETGDTGTVESFAENAGRDRRHGALGLEHTAPSRSPSALSLNLAQACNLGCHYCYADEGKFRGAPRLMPEPVALRAIDRLIDESDGERVTIGFIGGEPFLNGKVLHASVAYAKARAAAVGISIGFSVTTNATLLRARDIALLRDNAFAVTVSLDGDAATHDRHRVGHRGTGSFDRAVQSLQPLLRDAGGARIAARASVTRDDLRVAERIEALLDVGVHEAGVSPVRAGPMAQLALQTEDWARYLEEMKRAADRELERIRASDHQQPIRFSNLGSALREIHVGACRPLPCGAASNYVSLSAEGRYYTCHRTIGDSRFLLGGPEQGLSFQSRRSFLQSRHVDRQTPCRNCWARYLCGGSCHAEVVQVGREGCDFIRGWLEHCLQVYAELAHELPHLLDLWSERARRT